MDTSAASKLTGFAVARGQEISFHLDHDRWSIGKHAALCGGTAAVKRSFKRCVAVMAGSAFFVGSSADTKGSAPLPKVLVKSGPEGAWTSEAAVETNLKTFDALDFEVISNRDWGRLGESHSTDIIVTWPDTAVVPGAIVPS